MEEDLKINKKDSSACDVIASIFWLSLIFDDECRTVVQCSGKRGEVMNMEKLKPAVSKYWLIAIAGFMWSVVGIMLCRLAYIWLKTVPRSWSVSLGLLGIVSAVIAYRYGFLKIAGKNIDRLCLLSDKCCIFAFQAWRSYLIVIFMVTLGITLRHSPFPKHFLAVIYETIGGALFLSSLHFYRRIWRVKIRKQSCLISEEK